MAAPAPSAPRPRLSAVDLLLLFMTLIWGTNFSIVKFAFREMDPQAFNAVRMILASSVFLAVMGGMHRRSRPGLSGPPGDGVWSVLHSREPITPRDWIRLALLGLVGHSGYQYFFVGGVALTTVANSSLMLAATPVVIAIVSALLGHDRIGPLHWLGALLSLSGIYIVVGHGASMGGSLRGDLMMAGAVVCWAVYTIGARPLIGRHSPVGITGVSMVIGTLFYVPVMIPNLRATDWGAISASTWIALVYSTLFALCIAYTIWYYAVREIGSARTAVYSNFVPIVAMLTAVLFLGERLTGAKLLGGACVLVGVALTRVRRPSQVPGLTIEGPADPKPRT